MTSISANGATQTLYITEVAGSHYYRINNGSLTPITWPVTITNNNTSTNLKVLFLSNLTLSTDANQHLRVNSTNIQIGDTNLSSTGQRSVISVSVANYDGFIQNGNQGFNGFSNIYIYNLIVSGTGGSLQIGAGWIAKGYFAKGASDCYISNCASAGAISSLGGGIVGESAGSSSGSLTLRGCSSSGSIGDYAGGIAGHYAGYNSGSVTCEKCWSTGTIGLEAGGIFGDFAGTGSGSATATQCYSEDSIGQDGGGIFGSNGGEGLGVAIAQKCYSLGSIGTGAGGIFGLRAGYNSGSTSATNCYSKGSIATTGNGIFGSEKENGTTAQCYTANGSWSDSTADSSLTGVPDSSGVGTTWVKKGSNQPYELNDMGFTPYTTTIINSSSDLIQSYSQTVNKGESTVSALNADASGNEFEILQVTGGDSGSYATISMSAQTGAITTTSATAVGTYTIRLRSIGSYNITTFILTISPDADSSGITTCCVTTIDERGLDYAQINNYRIGNRLLLEVSQNSKTTFDGYSQYVKYKMAQGSRKV